MKFVLVRWRSAGNSRMIKSTRKSKQTNKEKDSGKPLPRKQHELVHANHEEPSLTQGKPAYITA